MSEKTYKLVFVNHRTGEITYDNDTMIKWRDRGDEVGVYHWSKVLNEMVEISTIRK